MDIYNFF